MEYTTLEEHLRKDEPRRRRQRILNWLICALHEADIKVDSIDIREDGVCEWANIDVGRGIFKVNVTGDSDIQMMIDILMKMRGV